MDSDAAVAPSLVHSGRSAAIGRPCVGQAAVPGGLGWRHREKQVRVWQRSMHWSGDHCQPPVICARGALGSQYAAMGVLADRRGSGLDPARAITHHPHPPPPQNVLVEIPQRGQLPLPQEQVSARQQWRRCWRRLRPDWWVLLLCGKLHNPQSTHGFLSQWSPACMGGPRPPTPPVSWTWALEP
jgi:hypothetical protein